jgi:D-3-phosphoglycerate dehydrogenase
MAGATMNGGMIPINRTTSYPKEKISILLLENLHINGINMFRDEGFNVCLPVCSVWHGCTGVQPMPPKAHHTLQLFFFCIPQVITSAKSMTEDELVEKIKDVHIIGIRSKTKITKKVLEAGTKLLAVGCFCIGTNQVDLESAATLGVCEVAELACYL